MMTPKIPEIPRRVLRHIDLIVIHCSGTSSGQSINQDNKNAAQVIDDWHRQRGFKRVQSARALFNPTLTSIGYHYVIDLDGSILTGRHLGEMGAHAQGFNLASIGICLIGGKEREAKYTLQQWTALSALLNALTTRFSIPYKLPQREGDKSIHGGICGHRDLSPDRNGNGLIEPFEWTKTCPGFSVQTWLHSYKGTGAFIGHIYTGALR